MRNILAFLSENLEMMYVQGIWSGSYEYLKTMKVRDEKKLTSIPNKKYHQSALNKLEMGHCKVRVSPKLDKASMDGDNEEIDEKQTTRFRSSAITLLYLSNETTDIQKYGTTVVYEVEKSDSVGDETVETTSGAQRTCQQCLRCVTTMTEDNSWSNDWKSTQTLIGRVIKRHGKARVVR